MGKSRVSFKDIGPLLIILVIVAVAYFSMRDRMNYNRDRINELVGEQAKLQSQVNDMERRLATRRQALPARPPSEPIAPPKMGDLSITTAGLEEPALVPALKEWMQALNKSYLPLKTKHKPPKGRAIVSRVIFDTEGKVNVFDYIKAPEDKALHKALRKAIQSSTLPKIAERLRIKLPYLSVQVSFEP